MKISHLLVPCLAVSMGLVVVACGNSSDSTPATNPAGGPEGGAGTAGSGGTSSEGGTSAAGGSTGGTSATGGSGGASTSTDVAQCTEDNLEDHTGDTAVTINLDPGGTFTFTPACIKVKTGTTVTLPNSSLHPVVGMTAHGTQPNPIPSTVTDPTTSTIPVTFTDAGNYGYYCMHHGHDAVGTAAAMAGGVYVVE